MRKAAAGRRNIFRSAFWAFILAYPRAPGGSVIALNSLPYYAALRVSVATGRFIHVENKELTSQNGFARMI
jgi:hypothetical protein